MVITATGVAIAESVQVLPLRLRFPAGGPAWKLNAIAHLGTAPLSTNTVG
jgi:hypothetical protein